MIDDLLSDALLRAAAALEHKQEGHLLEKHLKAALKMGLTQTIDEAGGRFVVGENEADVSKLAGFPGVGKVDVAVWEGPEHPAAAFIELKWGEGSLLHTAWDVIKLAIAEREGYAHRAFVVAGVPVGRWQTERGRELFDRRDRDAGDFMFVYGDLFAFSRGNYKCRPRRAPATIRTRPCARASLSVKGQPWEIRAVRVEAGGGDVSVNIDEAGQEVSRDRGDRFTSFTGGVEWQRLPVQPAEGRDPAGSDGGFHSQMLEDEAHDERISQLSSESIDARVRQREHGETPDDQN